ncbi:MAG TPA: NAD-dependent epimerase/dehydratase family protein [Jatrophihabitantaceae bacterium]|nr:NAD-dependent epimerase/dehydratase family protein [Jatrophihabitantaceae bacterium]
MRALITGGTGYVGGAVAAELAASGFHVTILGQREKAEVQPAVEATRLYADIRDRNVVNRVLTEGRYDTIVHLAGLARTRESFNEPLDYYETNIGGTINLLRAIESLPAELPAPSIIYGSSTLVYGSRYVGAVSETAAPEPESPYAETKHTIERLLIASANAGKLAGTILRIFNVAGGVNGVCDVDPTRIIPTLMRAAAEGTPVTLVGNGVAVRDFVHPADVATAVHAAIKAARPGACPIYNVGSGVGTRIIDALHCLEEFAGVEIKIEHTPQEGLPPSLIADITAAGRDLGWQPTRSDITTIISDAWPCWPTRAEKS